MLRTLYENGVELTNAIRKRPEPGEGIITYGTNRLEAYDPYLILAEAHLIQGILNPRRLPSIAPPSSAKSPLTCAPGSRHGSTMHAPNA